MKKIWVFVGIGAVLVAVLGVVGVGLAKSPEAQNLVSGVTSSISQVAYQEDDPAVEPNPEMWGWKPGRGNPRDFKPGRLLQLREYLQAATAEAFGLTVEELEARREAGDSLADIAAEQGLTVEEFQAKIQSIPTNAIAAALADGAITQEEADTMLANLAKRQEMKGEIRRHQDGPIAEYMDAALADAFGLTVEEFQAKKDAGLTLMDIAIEQGLTVADFQEKVKTARNAAIDKALADGVITEKQAEFLRERLNGDHGFGSRWFGDGPKGFRNPHGFGPGGHGRGGFNGDCPAVPETAPDSGTGLDG